MSTSKVRAVVITINNPTGPIEWPAYVRYGVYQREIGEQGTEHYQGYAEFITQQRFSALKKWLPTAHFEARKGTRDQARAYCMKEDTRVDGPWEHGSWAAGGQGTRNELDAAIECVKSSLGSTRPLKRLAEEHPREFVKYHRGLTALANELVEPRSSVPEVRVFVGRTGVGKSRAAREWLQEPNPAKWGPAKGKWFDGYLGQTKFLFEEFRGQLTLGMMLDLLDRYDAEVEVKGGIVHFCATQIAITSPLHPTKWYKSLDKEDRIDQLMRRITTVVELSPPEEDYEDMQTP